MGAPNRYTTNNARRLGFASGLEKNISDQLKLIDRKFEYESDICLFTYHKPIVNGCLIDSDGAELDIPKTKVVQRCKYTCDFVIWKKNGEPMFIESKGFFKSSDRAKHKLLKKKYPDADIRLLFSNNGLVSKKPRTRYTDWAEKFGFTCHVATSSAQKKGNIVPQGWLDE